MIVRRLALASALVLAPPAVEQGGERTAPRLEPGNPSKLIRFERTEPVSFRTTDSRPVTWVPHSRPTIDAATAMLSQIGLSVEQGVGNICHSLEREGDSLGEESGATHGHARDVAGRSGRTHGPRNGNDAAGPTGYYRDLRPSAEPHHEQPRDR